MSGPGAPTGYYGDEAGLCGWTDPDNRRAYPWGNEDMEMVEFHRDIIRIHKSTSALVDGSFKQLYSDYNVISFGRFKRNSQAVTIINNNDVEKQLVIPVWECGIRDGKTLEQAILSTDDGYETYVRHYSVVDGKLTITMPPHSATIIVSA